MEFFLKNGKNM